MQGGKIMVPQTGLLGVSQSVDITGRFFSSARVILAGLAILTFSTISGIRNSTSGLVLNDASSYLAPLNGIFTGTGLPYADFLDIKPPMLLASLQPWIWAFGSSIQSMVILDILLVSTLLMLFYILLRRLSSSPIPEIVSLIVMIFALTRNAFSQLLLSETVGLIWVFLALYLLVRFGSSTLWPYIVAGIFFAFAMQAKEVYSFAGIAGAIWAFERRPVFRKLFSLLLGFLVGQILTVLLLLSWGSLGAYLDVLNLKVKMFPSGSSSALIENTKKIVGDSWPVFFSLGRVTLALVVLVMIICVLVVIRKGRWLEDKSHVVFCFTAASLLVACSLGSSWQGKEFLGHYQIGVFIPLYLFVGSVAVLSLRIIRQVVPHLWLQRTMAILVITFLIPPLNTFALTANSVSAAIEDANWRLTPAQDWTNAFRVIADRTPQQGCIQVAYGWASGAVYLNTDRRPCSPIFLANFALEPSLAGQLRDDLIMDPPNAIVYLLDEPGLDVARFEKQIFPYQRVIDQCYARTNSPFVWVAKNSEMLETQHCIKSTIQNDNTEESASNFGRG
jgi:hypothetical protein